MFDKVLNTPLPCTHETWPSTLKTSLLQVIFMKDKWYLIFPSSSIKTYHVNILQRKNRNSK